MPQRGGESEIESEIEIGKSNKTLQFAVYSSHTQLVTF